jgi:tetratricopeptide (TPR) repeat protein
VYDQLLGDLEAAYQGLEGYARGGNTDIDQSVAAGLLARVYLEMGDYTNAADMASKAKEGYTLMSNDDWMSGFSNINNAEWMWGADIDAETSTIYASFFSHMGNLDPGYAGLLGVYKSVDARLYDAMSDTDIRKTAFAGDDDPDGLPKYANKKFKDLVSFFEGDYLYMRAAEMYLIEAEALANSGDEAGAQQLLFDLVSPRDPNYVKSTKSGQALLDEIYLHRRIELWGEGFAWYDQKRLGIDLERDYEGSNHTTLGNFNFAYNANEMIFQIPEDEINANDLINEEDQNPL